MSDGILERLVELDGLVQNLEDGLTGMECAGKTGTLSLAGTARTAMLGAGLAMAPRDFLFGTARDLPAALARGAALDLVCAQLLGVGGDPSLGRGLPGAFNDVGLRTSLSDGNVASHLVHACGFGLSARLRGDDCIALGLFGNAAQDNGEIHGALNFAGVYRAQVVFVARGDLGAAIPFEEAAEAWGLRVVTVHGDRGVEIAGAVREARDRALQGEGATIVDARLQSAWEPVDAKRLQDEQPGDAAETAAQRRVRLREAVGEALKRAESAEPIDPVTMHQGLFA